MLDIIILFTIKLLGVLVILFALLWVLGEIAMKALYSWLDFMEVLSEVCFYIVHRQEMKKAIDVDQDRKDRWQKWAEGWRKKHGR